MRTIRRVIQIEDSNENKNENKNEDELSPTQHEVHLPGHCVSSSSDEGIHIYVMLIRLNHDFILRNTQ